MPRAPLFLARQGYRRRRLADMARLLPILGLALFLAPVLDARDGLTATMLIYLFSAWLGLIAVSALLARNLCRAGLHEDDATDAAEDAP